VGVKCEKGKKEGVWRSQARGRGLTGKKGWDGRKTHTKWYTKGPVTADEGVRKEKPREKNMEKRRRGGTKGEQGGASSQGNGGLERAKGPREWRQTVVGGERSLLEKGPKKKREPEGG